MKWYYDAAPFFGQQSVCTQHTIIAEDGEVIVSMTRMTLEVARQIVREHNANIT